MPQLAQRDAGQRVDAADSVDLVAKELNAHHVLVRVNRPDLDRVAAYAETVALEHHIVALILDVDQAVDQLFTTDFHAWAQRNDHLLVIDRVTERIDARYRRDDDHVPPLRECRGCGVAQAVDLVVDRGVLFNVGVGRSDIGLGLVIIVITHKILDRVMREELAQLGAELRGKCFIVCEHQRRPLGLLDDVGHGKGLARAGHTHERLLGQAVVDALDQLRDRFGLVARHFVWAYDLKIRHWLPPLFNKPCILYLADRCIFSPCDYAVIHQLDIQAGKHLAQPVCNKNIFLRRPGCASRVIMRDCYAHRVAKQCAPRNLIRIDRHMRMSAACDFLAFQHTPLSIQIGGKHHFVPLVCQLRHKVFPDTLIAVQPVAVAFLPADRRPVAAEHRIYRFDQIRCMRTNPLNLLQLLGRRLKYRMQRAEPVEQAVCGRIGIALPHRKVQQDLQRLMIGKNVHAELAELRHGPFPVSGMRMIRHWAASFFFSYR